jgi:hypothetical protein
MKLEIERFQDYLANDVRRKDLPHRIGVVANIERRWNTCTTVRSKWRGVVGPTR